MIVRSCIVVFAIQSCFFPEVKNEAEKIKLYLIYYNN